MARQRRRRHDLAVRSMSIDAGFAIGGRAAILVGVYLIAIRYKSPVTGAPVGIAYPVLILIGVTLLMGVFGESPSLRPLCVRLRWQSGGSRIGWYQHPTYRSCTPIWSMGVLCAVSAAIQTARLNSATTNLGVQNELDVIAAAVIGGTSFSGGIGTIPGAVLGAVVMQSLRSGMSLLNIDSPSQDIVVGVVLVTAVAVDALLRQRRRANVFGALGIGVIVAAWVIQTGRP